MTSVAVRVKRLRESEGVTIPAYMTTHAAGVDLHAAIDAPIHLQPGARVLVPTGLAIELPDGYEAQIRPRSGLAFKHGISLVNTPGTIDPDYRGEISIIVINHGSETFVINAGERIAQMVIAPFIRAVFAEVDSLTETGRGSGGFGHTGR